MDTQNPQQLPNCSYQYHNNGIHEYVLRDGSRAAFDDFATLMAQVEATDTNQGVLTQLLDMRQGTPPLTYAYNMMRQYIEQLEVRRTVRLAILHDAARDIELVNSLVDLLQVKGTVQFFTDRQKAMAWLLDVTV